MYICKWLLQQILLGFMLLKSDTSYIFNQQNYMKYKYIIWSED